MFIAQGVGRFVVHAYALVGRQCLPDPARLASAVGSIRFRRASPCVAAALRRRAPQRGSTTVLSASALEYFRIGDWIVYPRENVLARAGERVAIEPRAMETLEFLAYHAGAVVSADRLLAECWPNIEIGDNPVHKAIAQLRKAMGDQASSPRYIETIRKRGYRLLAPVTLPSGYRGPVAHAGTGWARGSPFRGLAAFDDGDSAIFFGRDAAVALLLRSLEVQWRSGCAFVLLTGASGSGKTSLLRAGLLPRLSPGGVQGMDVVAVCHCPGHGPDATGLVETLAAALAERTQPALFGFRTAAEWRHSLDTEPERAVTWLVSRIAASAHRELGGLGGTPALVVVIDQLEDFFQDPGSKHERARTVALLRLLACSGAVAVVAACRSDAYPRLAEVPGLLALKQPAGHADLMAPSAAEITEIIRRPAAMAALSFEQGEAGRLDDILRDAAVDHPQCLPLLQYALQQLYERRESGGRLTCAAYASMGGLDGALRNHAERCIGELSLPAQKALPALLSRLVRHSAAGEHIGCVAAQMREFAAAPERELVDAMVRARLLVSASAQGQATVAIAHEALLRAWPRARAWLEDNRDDLRRQARLSESAARWEASGRRRDLLLPPGQLLEEARDLNARRSDLIDAGARGFLTLSIGRERRRAWLRRGAIGGALGLAGIALAGVSVAQRARLQAETERGRAEGMVEYMLGDLSERLERLGRLDLLDSVTTRVLADVRASGQSDEASQAARAKVLRQIGKIRVARGDVAAAETAIAQSVAIAQALADASPASVERLYELGESRYWQGYLRFLGKDREQARAQWQRYRQAAERAAQLAPRDPRAWTELSYAINSLGTLEHKRERYAEALALFETSVRYKQKALALSPDNTRLRVDLVDSRSWVASALDKLGQWERAQDQYSQAITAIAGVRKQAPEDAEWMYREAILRSQQGQILRSLERYDAAGNQFEAAVAMLDALGREQPERSDWARDRVATHNAAGELDLTRDLDRAQRHFDEAERVLDGLVDSSSSVRDLDRLRLRLSLNRARLAAASGRVDAAMTELERTQRMMGPVASASSKKERLAQAELFLLRAQLLRSRDRGESERAYALAADRLGAFGQNDREARDIRRRLQREWPSADANAQGDAVVSR